MPSLSDHPASSLLKILGVGDTGTAKSGSLASLALAGYYLKIADFDNGVDVLFNLLKGHPEALARVEYETFTNEYEWTGEAPKGAYGEINPTKIRKSKPKTTDAFHNGLRKVSEWTSCGPDTWLVVDSLTALGAKSMENTQALTGTLGKPPTQPEWGSAMADLENFLQLMASKAVTCNTIMFTHKTYVETDEGVSSPYPMALGSKLPPKVPRFFNTMIGYVVEGADDSAQRKIVTNPWRGLGFKTTNPGAVKSQYVLNAKTPEKGLIDFVKDVGVALP